VSRPTPIPRPDLAQLVARARPIRGLAVIGAIVMLALATACGASASEHTSLPVDTEVAPSSTSPDPTSATADPSDTTAADVVARYQEFWQVWLRANNPPNPDYPDLAMVATGEELDKVKSDLRQNLAEGTYNRLRTNSRYRHDAVFGGVERGVAVVMDCAFDDGEIVSEDTGEVINSDIATQEILGSLVNLNGQWTVSAIRIQKQSPGESTCFGVS
jgi:hypothetical protein